MVPHVGDGSLGKQPLCVEPPCYLAGEHNGPLPSTTIAPPGSPRPPRQRRYSPTPTTRARSDFLDFDCTRSTQQPRKRPVCGGETVHLDGNLKTILPYRSAVEPTPLSLVMALREPVKP